MLSQMPSFPFAAVSGQAQFKLALILVAIDSSIGGVLVSGPRGSAKSTLARGLVDLLPGDHPFVTLPLGASEEMLVGTLDLQKVLDQQKVDFHPGLLSRAHNGVLYVDEVNLLPDNLVDLLLDAAASGINCVERDGVSHTHAAEFILLGTMNPDEGELRPQLLDRFGLSVEIDNRYKLEDRVAIVRLREAYDRDPDAFVAQYIQQQQEICKDIQAAIKCQKSVQCPEGLRIEIAQRCQTANVDGLRADIVWHRAAVAHAAWQKRSQVSMRDIDAVETLVLCHRRNTHQDPTQSETPKPFSRPAESRQQKASVGDWGSMETVRQETAAKSLFELPNFKNNQPSTENRLLNLVARPGGRIARGFRKNKNFSNKPDWFSTLVSSFGRWPPEKIRRQKDKSGESILHLVMLDTSASTIKHQQFAKAKAVILDIADQAYLQRQQITILGFGNQQVETLLTRKRAPRALKKLLDEVRAGGGTPFRQVLQQAYQYQLQLLRQLPGLRIHNYLITDGKTSQSLQGLQLLGQTSLIDVEQSDVKRGKGQQIAEFLNARYFPLPV